MQHCSVREHYLRSRFTCHSCVQVFHLWGQKGFYAFKLLKPLFPTFKFKIPSNVIIWKIKQRNALMLLPPTNLNLCMISSISLFEHFFFFFLLVVCIPLHQGSLTLDLSSGDALPRCKNPQFSQVEKCNLHRKIRLCHTNFTFFFFYFVFGKKVFRDLIQISKEMLSC